MKELYLAKTAGFCYGVRRAVELAEQAAESGVPCVMLGPVIHNKHVVASLTEKGIPCVERVDQVPEGVTVIIRSHGEGRSVYEALRQRDLPILDATCPNVERIHRLVEEAEAGGRRPVIIGSRQHPEVRAIADWCREPLIFETAEEVAAWLEEAPDRRNVPLTFVSQTTATQKLWKSCVETAKKVCTNFEKFDTICNATFQRQEEAAQIAAQCDAVVVIGDSQSANTGKLAEICGQACPHLFRIQSATELELSQLKNLDRVGVTAGASTPQWIIKEVYDMMDEEIKMGEDIVDKTEETVEETVTEETAAEAPAAAEPAAEEPATEEPTTEEATEKPKAEETPAEEPELPGIEEVNEDDTFDQMLDKTFKTLNSGEKVTGIVTAITATEVHVDLGAKHAGYIPVTELSNDPDVDVNEIVKVGDPIETYIMRVNDAEGVVTLSKKRLDTIKSWDDVELARENQTAVEGTVIEDNKGGVVVSVNGIRVFVPASRTGLPKGAAMSELLKEKVRLRITEVNRARHRVVGSIRAVQYEERRAAAEAVWKEIEVGKHYNGVVKSMTSYGAFVDIGGVDGMVHISELTWSRIKHPSEVVNVGDTVDVYVISYDPEKKKISLGMKDRSQDPWTKFMETYSVGSVANVTVVKLMDFGAFAEVIPGVDGLIHISQIADHRIDKPGDILEEGQKVDVKITDINEETHKISLSIRALLLDKQRAAAAMEVDED
ncbi:MAG: bifunctional 4-hydroxy-3-methylbut-2-enyl diphosphate reductase/30S ribosomal protein S1 [Oscillospiraceae bacterium]|nr:bifunctional 4-hydroxy-3-methylbut-2-enyl diphosphate reductase/30S ribosomal protein S1 [Oscillospiraceae bacterium]